MSQTDEWEESPHRDETEESPHRAVSPVIGVILMVAITVILAAVIGAFVLEIGDQQETAPNTSWSTEEQSVFYDKSNTDTGSCCGKTINTTEVTFTHAGGDVIDIRNLRIKTEGYPGAIGPRRGFEDHISDPDLYVPASNYPDHIPALGTNDNVPISSGESMPIWGFGSRPPDTWLDSSAPSANAPGYPDRDPLVRSTDPTNTDRWPCIYIARSEDGDWSTQSGGYRVWQDGEAPPNCAVEDQPTHAGFLESGMNMRITWKSESGGKSQTLHKYTVQHTTSP